MTRRSPILEKLAELYALSAAGKTGQASRDFSVAYEELLQRASCSSGDAYVLAQQDLRSADAAGALRIKAHHRSHAWQRIQVSLEQESALFAMIGRESPAALRARWVALFSEASDWSVPETFRVDWHHFCQHRRELAMLGKGWSPFRMGQIKRAEWQLRIVAELLAWQHPGLLRTVSVRITGSSKALERSSATFESLIRESSGGALGGFADLKIESNPGSVRFHGPLRLHLPNGVTDYTPLTTPLLSDADLAAAQQISTDARRVVLVENKTKFHELSHLNSGDLFILTSYPNRATIALLKSLPDSLHRYHFGDTDPWGFDVLLKLRQLSGLKIEPLHMCYRPKPGSPPFTARDQRKLASLLVNPLLADVRDELEILQQHACKGDFEQESLLLSSHAFPYIENSPLNN